MQHRWIKLTRQAVDVIVDPEGQVYSSERPGEAVGEVVGCDACGQPMTPKFFFLDCVPTQAAVPA